MAGKSLLFFSKASAAPNSPVAPTRNTIQIFPLFTFCFGNGRAKLVASCGATVCGEANAGICFFDGVTLLQLRLPDAAKERNVDIQSALHAPRHPCGLELLLERWRLEKVYTLGASDFLSMVIEE